MLAAQSSVVFAEPTDRWWSGWGMGIHEYGWSGSDGTSIYITCESATEMGLSVAIKGVDPKPSSEVHFFLNGQNIRFWTNPDGAIDTKSRVGLTSLYFLFDELRAGREMTLAFDGLSKTLSLKGSSKGLGPELCE
jgi:hypothetical protein